MKKLIFAALILFSGSLAHADTRWMSPFVILGVPNTWTATQTFQDIIINGTCTGSGCGTGGSGQNYPDYTIDGTDNYNTTTSNSITVREMNIEGDVYIMNLYTSPQ